MTVNIVDTIEIEAPARRVWELTADVERWPDHTPTMRSVRWLDDGPLRTGRRAEVDQPGQRPRIWTVTEVQAPARFEWSAEVLGSTMTAVHHIEPTGDSSCRNVLEVHLAGRRARLLSRLARRPIARALRQENQGFRKAAEASAREV